MNCCKDCGVVTTNLISVTCCIADCTKAVCYNGCYFPCLHCGHSAKFKAARDGPQDNFVCPLPRCRLGSPIPYCVYGRSAAMMSGWHNGRGELEVTLHKTPLDVKAGNVEAAHIVATTELLRDGYYDVQSGDLVASFWQIMRELPFDIREQIGGMIAFRGEFSAWRCVTQSDLEERLTEWCLL